MRAAPSWALVLLAACGGAREEKTDSALPMAEVGAGIVGGAESADDSAVFLLDIERFDDTGSKKILCSATLVGTRSLLTAGHCLAHAGVVRASNSARWTSDPSVWLAVESVWLHPDYDANRPGTNDLAFALLAERPAVKPKAWNRQAVNGLTGAALRAVGYGTALADGQTSGVRRTADLTFREIQPQIVRLGDRSGRGICHGDSGGPSFHLFPDGVERLVGVHSFTSREDCVDGGDIRLDAYSGFMTEWLASQDAEGLDPTELAADGAGDNAPSCGGSFWPIFGLPWALRRRKRRLTRF